MTRRTRPVRRTIALLLRDARGRFMRVLPTVKELLSARRPRAPRRSCAAVVNLQLALF